MPVKLEWFGYRTVNKLWQYVKPFSSDTGTSRTDGRTDRQTYRRTELLYQYRVSVCWRAIKKLSVCFFILNTVQCVTCSCCHVFHVGIWPTRMHNARCGAACNNHKQSYNCQESIEACDHEHRLYGAVVEPTLSSANWSPLVTTVEGMTKRT